MAFVRVDADRTWVAEEGLRTAPQIIQVATGDSSYVNLDFSNVIKDDVAISSVVWSEKDSKTITIADQDVSSDGKRVSCKLSGMAAGDFTLRATATLSSGTTQTISKDGVLKAVA